MIKLVEVQGGLRMFRRKQKVLLSGFSRYSGSAEDICLKIIEDCWDSKNEYFRISNGHFCEFYVRDFAHCVEALLKLGYQKRVKSTLKYALNVFEINGSIEQSISPKGKPFSFPSYSPDALALLMHAIVVAKQEELARKHRDLFQREVDRFVRAVVNPKTLLPRTDRSFSGMRDHAKRQGSCYDAVMILLVAKYASRLGLKFPHAHKDIAKAFISSYWSGQYFYSDLHRQPIVTGDSNVFPFWTKAMEGAISEYQIAQMCSEAVASMHSAQLDYPWPLRYVNTKDTLREVTRLHFSNLFAYGYQTHSIWMNIGMCMLDILAEKDMDAARKHLNRIEKLINKYGTFLEVYDRWGRPFRTIWYVSDEAMLWCAQWLALRRDASKP